MGVYHRIILTSENFTTGKCAIGKIYHRRFTTTLWSSKALVENVNETLSIDYDLIIIVIDYIGSNDHSY